MIATDTRTSQYDTRHGGPYDRGSADSYYSRGYHPHYFEGATSTTPRVDLENMTAAEITAYTVAGAGMDGAVADEDVGRVVYRIGHSHQSY